MQDMGPEPRAETVVPVYIALGSNLGDSKEVFRRALVELQSLSPHPLQVSSFWATSPVDCPPGSPDFLNAVARVLLPPETEPESLLKRLQELEKRFGRTSKVIQNEARPLDLDIIAFGDIQRATQELSMPHPRAHLRRFVLAPLAELAPDLVLPGQNATVSELLERVAPDPRMYKAAPAPPQGGSGDSPVTP